MISLCTKRELKGPAQKERHKQNDKAAKTAWPFIPRSMMSSSTGTQRDSQHPFEVIRMGCLISINN